MTRSRQILEFFFAPHLWLLLYIFMVLTGAGSDYQILKTVLAEQGIFVFATALATASLLARGDTYPDRWLWLGLILCGILLAPLFSSLANDHRLTILTTSRYRQLLKIAVCFFLLVAVTANTDRARLRGGALMTIVLATLALSGAVIIRFFLLGEAHPETGRLNLVMRHGNANYVAAYLGTLMVLNVFAATEFFRSAKSGWMALSFLGALLASVGVLASASRMGVLAVLAAFAVVAVLESRRRHSRTPIIILCLGLVILSGIGIGMDAFSRFATILDPSSLGRVQGIKAGLILFSNSPFFGAGFDQTPVHIYQLTSFPLFREFAAPPVSLHNAWFQMLSEMGAFGFLWLTLLWLWCLWQVMRLAPGVQRTFSVAALLVVWCNQQTLPVAYNDVFYCLPLLIAVLAISGRKQECSQNANAGFFSSDRTSSPM